MACSGLCGMQANWRTLDNNLSSLGFTYFLLLLFNFHCNRYIPSIEPPSAGPTISFSCKLFGSNISLTRLDVS